MGRFIKDTTVKVGLVGVREDTAKKLIERFTTVSANDPGTFKVVQLKDLGAAKTALTKNNVNAICIALESFGIDESVGFVADVRVTYPLVPFCLVGTREFLDKLPGFHEAWKIKFSHYYKLASDDGDDDFDENAGVLRDLFVADSVKCRVLGNYETTPGAVVRIRAPRPYGFWVLVAVAFLSAVAGGAVGPLVERLWPAAASDTSHSREAAQQGTGADRQGPHSDQPR